MGSYRDAHSAYSYNTKMWRATNVGLQENGTEHWWIYTKIDISVQRMPYNEHP